MRTRQVVATLLLVLGASALLGLGACDDEGCGEIGDEGCPCWFDDVDDDQDGDGDPFDPVPDHLNAMGCEGDLVCDAPGFDWSMGVCTESVDEEG